ncbi:MAG: hypothetical protein ACTSWX_05290 [Promethearchaeota archaeon]
MVFSKIALDSNVFRNYDFINYLTLYSSDFEIYLPTIVQLEVGYFYRMKNLNWKKFKADLDKFRCKFIKCENFKPSEIIENAYRNRKELPFRHHFRDYMIATECEDVIHRLITYNTQHFTWVKKFEIITPENFVKEHLKSKKKKL